MPAHGGGMRRPPLMRRQGSAYAPAPRWWSMRLSRALLIVFALSGAVAAPAPAAELVMFEAEGCPFCARWHRDIGPIYPKTDEGKRAPLRRVDISGPRPADLAGIRDVVYTPTFVLIDDGRELGRIV